MGPNDLTPLQKLEYRFFYDAVRKLDFDLRSELWWQGCVPRAWKTLIQDDGRPEKIRITLRLDADVVKFFRGKWARGYQAEINTVLRSFLKLHLSKLIRGDMGFEELLAEAQTDGLPQKGDAERSMNGDGLLGGFGAFPEPEE